MFYFSIIEEIRKIWDRYMDMSFPHLKYKDSFSLPSRDKISKRVVKSFQIMWCVSAILGGLIGFLSQAGWVPLQVVIRLIVGLILLAIGIFLASKSMKPVGRDYWQKWWRGEIQWWKILRL